MTKCAILILFMLLILSQISCGLEIPGRAMGNVSPFKGAMYLSAPTTGVEEGISVLCKNNEIYHFTYRFDMSAFSDKGRSSETTQALLLIYNPETGKWLNAGSQMYDGAQNTLEFKVDFGELFRREEVGGESYIYRPFLGMSKFKLVSADNIIIPRGGGIEFEKTSSLGIGLMQSLSDEILGPEIVINFRNPQWSKPGFENLYTYSVEARSSEPNDVIIYGTKDGSNWETYEASGKKFRSSGNLFDWKKISWTGAPRFSKLEFALANCN
jgi:hypothetical protein